MVGSAARQQYRLEHSACGQCSTGFETLQCLRRHLSSVHFSQSLVDRWSVGNVCSLCRKDFSVASQTPMGQWMLASHIGVFHNKVDELLKSQDKWCLEQLDRIES